MSFKRELNALKMDWTDDPNDVCDKLLIIKAKSDRIGAGITDNDLVYTLMDITPHKYGTLTTEEARRHEEPGAENNGLTLEHLRQVMSDYYKNRLAPMVTKAKKQGPKLEDVLLSTIMGQTPPMQPQVQAPPQNTSQHRNRTCFNC